MVQMLPTCDQADEESPDTAGGLRKFGKRSIRGDRQTVVKRSASAKLQQTSASIRGKLFKLRTAAPVESPSQADHVQHNRRVHNHLSSVPAQCTAICPLLFCNYTDRSHATLLPMELDYDTCGVDSLPAPTLDRWGRDEIDFEMDFRAGDIQSQSELLPFSSNACTTQPPPAAGMHNPPRPRISKSVSQKDRATLVPLVPPTNRQLRSQNRDRLYQEKKRLRKEKDLSNEEGINLVTANAIPPANVQSCHPAKIIPPCSCPLCPRRFERYGLIQHLLGTHRDHVYYAVLAGEQKRLRKTKKFSDEEAMNWIIANAIPPSTIPSPAPLASVSVAHPPPDILRLIENLAEAV